MNKWFPVAMAAACCSTLVMPVNAADIRLNGFASIAAGKTLNEGVSLTDGAFPRAEPTKATYLADAPTNGVYDDEISFNPDSIFGLQINADLDQLTVTAQITGAGGEDFEANIAWAYVSYAVTEHLKVQGGRQRIPAFFYSDFLDVGYAYHWIRPPTETTNIPLDTYEGVSALYETTLGEWTTQFQLIGGNSDGTSAIAGSLGIDGLIGGSVTMSNPWLQLRGSYAVGDFYVDQLEALGQGEDDPVDLYYASLAAHITLGNSFIMMEALTYEFDDPIAVIGWTVFEGGYISVGHSIGDFTPHLTYSIRDQELEGALGIGDANEKAESITAGLRWDFHPAAAFKVEYQVRSDESDQSVIDYKGDYLETDLVSFGVDVVF